MCAAIYKCLGSEPDIPQIKYLRLLLTEGVLDWSAEDMSSGSGTIFHFILTDLQYCDDMYGINKNTRHLLHFRLTHPGP
jgi:hypothetical protein